ncbi:MAG: oxidoreductase, partial [Acidimicrobiaceae bacterium]|nr:oxidoreductase [Acidimicrobiaceae bacterium]
MTVHGYIGLGMMGSAMCERLATNGAAVLAHDVNPAAVDAAVERGATAAGSTEEVA